MKNIRLPKYIQPERYRILLKPDLKGFTFEGEETIDIVLRKPANEIILHSKELVIHNVELRTKNGKLNQGARSTVYNPENETVIFKFNKKIFKGKVQLGLKFKGVLNDKMKGFYRSRYMHEGREKHLAVSQFEATDARQAIPCFDEPQHKAIFDVTLMVPKNLKAISNTIESEVLEHEAGYRLVKFEPTPKMSTYLLAFIVGDFEFIEGRTKDKVLVRVFVTPGKKHQARFALETAIKCLEFYNKYFDIPYPLPVLDLIAIPDFAHGAMENWGAVTYRESALLVDPQHSSASNKQWVALVIAHELAHQWFGNLVTMEWWTHLWLNEGFASYMEYVAVHELFPQWDIWTQFAHNDLGVALKLDSLKSTHPVEVEVGHPNEIGEIFDEVSYSKGASVIRMLADYLGEKNFRGGLRYYLKKYSYRNASTIHLWQALEKISKKPIRKIMQAWTSKPGYPLLNVDLQGRNLKLSQERFFSSPLSKKAVKDNSIWPIPIKIHNQNKKSQNFLLLNKSAAIGRTKTGWVKFNPGETGFYRTAYPKIMLEALSNPVFTKQLPPIDRLGIIRDVFALVEAGKLATDLALELTGNYKAENDYTVWVTLASGLDFVNNLVFRQNFYILYEKFCRNLFSGLANKLGWQPKPGEAHTQILLRNLSLYHAGNFGDKKVINRALDLYKNPKTIPPDLRAIVYALTAENSGQLRYKDFVCKYKSGDLSEEKNRIGQALGHFKQPDLLQKTLEFAFSPFVRYQDTPGFITAVWNNPRGQDIAWNFTKKNWPKILSRYPGSSHMLSRFIKPASVFKTAAQAQDAARFFKTHKTPAAERTVRQVLEKIRSNIEWLKRDRVKIEDWLIKKHGVEL